MSDDGFADLNAMRAATGENPVTDYAPWDVGCDHANNYNQLNGTGTHNEIPGNPGYTTDGAAAAGNAALGTSPDAAPTGSKSG